MIPYVKTHSNRSYVPSSSLSPEYLLNNYYIISVAPEPEYENGI